MKSTPLAKILAVVTFVVIGGGFFALPWTLQKAENVSVRNKALKEAVIFDTASAATAAQTRVFKLSPGDARLRGLVNQLENALGHQADELGKAESLHQYLQEHPEVEKSKQDKAETEHGEKMAEIAKAIESAKRSLTDWRP